MFLQVHLSPFKSPPKQVRVPDKDQRVWNDDDDIAAADLMDVGEEMESDDFDDDYEPSIHVTNPWSRQAGSHQVRQVATNGFTNFKQELQVLHVQVCLAQEVLSQDV